MSQAPATSGALTRKLTEPLRIDFPRSKFELIEKESTPRGWRVWPRENWWLTDEEIGAFQDIGDRLERGVEIDPAMELFCNLVTNRARRMVDDVFRQLPDAELFAADKGGAGTDASPEPQIAAALR